VLLEQEGEQLGVQRVVIDDEDVRLCLHGGVPSPDS
jgi:hypothetical protein